MYKKGRLLAGVLCAVIAALMIVPAAAHGCHRNSGHHGRYANQVQTTITVCPYENCTLAGRHTHGGVTHCGDHPADGLGDGPCRALGPLERCDLAGRHTHDGVTYCGYHHQGGFCDGACQALCPYEDCAVAGIHTHSGVSYCGNSHSAGFCGGGCAAGTGCGRWA